MAEAQPDPRGAFLRSLIMPGWGHHYVDSDSWARGQLHMGADLALIGSYFGFDARADNLQQRYTTLAELRAGVPVDGRNRSFQLALAQYNSLQEYNDQQLRSRNWHNILPDTPENRWQWNSVEDRHAYRDLREDADRARNQLPAIAAMLVVNRVVSAVSAFNRARNLHAPELTIAPVMDGRNQTGAQATLSFRF